MVAAGLGPRVAKHRPRVVNPDGPVRLLQVGGEDGPQHPRGALGPEREGPAAAIGEGEHLLLDHVGAGPGPPLVHLGRLEDRGVDELVAVGGRHPAMGLQHPLAEAGLGREEVVGAPGARDRRHGSEVYPPMMPATAEVGGPGRDRVCPRLLLFEELGLAVGVEPVQGGDGRERRVRVADPDHHDVVTRHSAQARGR